jgi:hypothetical protein
MIIAIIDALGIISVDLSRDIVDVFGDTFDKIDAIFAVLFCVLVIFVIYGLTR